MPGINHCAQVEQRPAVTPLAVARELVLVTVQARDAAEVNHAASVTPKEAHGVSRERVNSGPLIRW